jgi:hypothetical protein
MVSGRTSKASGATGTWEATPVRSLPSSGHDPASGPDLGTSPGPGPVPAAEPAPEPAAVPVPVVSIRARVSDRGPGRVAGRRGQGRASSGRRP